ncbi:MAG TPA: hypothetical protein VG387_05965 [Rhizomicrobium sp.]|jgi:hypothetical protein|nr:hypothetical protein [Rhizomicrobium sp.]
MLKWFMRRRVYRFGQELANTVTSEIDARIEASVIPRCQKGFEVLVDRFSTIWDNPPHDPRVFAHAEFETYENHFKRFLGEARAEINISAYKWDEAIERADIRGLLDEFVSRRFDEIASECDRTAKALLNEVLTEVGRRESELNKGIFVSEPK